jgi:diguanylate cyclase (GGDEF)-like protein/PAS domain S-box-containing protein
MLDAESPGPARRALEVLEQLVAAIEAAPNVAVYSIGPDGKVRFWNDSCFQLFGIDRQGAIGQPLVSLASRMHAQQEFEEALRAIWETGEPAPARDWHIQRHDGTRRWVYSNYFPVIRDKQAREIFCMEIDISARKNGEASLALAATVFDHCRDAIMMLDDEHRVLAVNPAHKAITGFKADEVIGHVLPGPQEGMDALFHEHVFEIVAEHMHWEGELLAVRKNGERFPAWVSLTGIYGEGGALSHYMEMLTDISRRKGIEEKNRHLAEHDFLTDLPNRVLFMDRLHQALAASRRKRGKIAVMFIDLDRFKGINDGFGHDVGDAVLKEVAARLTRCVRGADTVGRQGGDEFVIILDGIGGADQAAHVAGTIMQAVSQPFVAGSLSLSLSVSIGIAIAPNDGKDVDTLLKNADVAMYHAKQDGRNGMQFFSPEMNAHVVERANLENHLRQALANGEFELAYQPCVDFSTGRVNGVEALLRWRHPQRGLLLPQQFIKVAEECGLIVEIGDWVLRTACEQARAWHGQGVPVTVAVNLSNLQFLHNNLVGSVDDALQRSGLPPAFLELEVVEGIITNGDERTVAALTALRERGVRLTVDDFGTGVSSLSYLRRFQLSKLKIDRSFIEEIKDADNGSDIIPAIIAMARSLKLRVVAEGVETAEQLRFLRELGCDEYQGYYASPATPEPDLTRQHP